MLTDAIAARAQLERRVQRCADAGLLGDGRPVPLVAMQFHALCLGLAEEEINGWLAAFGDLQAVWEEACRSLIRGMAQPSAGRRRRETINKAKTAKAKKPKVARN